MNGTELVTALRLSSGMDEHLVPIRCPLSAHPVSPLLPPAHAAPPPPRPTASTKHCASWATPGCQTAPDLAPWPAAASSSRGPLRTRASAMLEAGFSGMRALARALSPGLFAHQHGRFIMCENGCAGYAIFRVACADGNMQRRRPSPSDSVAAGVGKPNRPGNARGERGQERVGRQARCHAWPPAGGQD